jgi:hypothetical protein
VVTGQTPAFEEAVLFEWLPYTTCWLCQHLQKQDLLQFEMQSKVGGKKDKDRVKTSSQKSHDDKGRGTSFNKNIFRVLS